MPYPTEHAARMMDPSQFDAGSFRRKTIAKGIDIILGMKNGRMMTQAYRFDSSVFTADKAREWMVSHGLKFISFEKATGKMQSFVSLVMMPIQAFSSNEILALIPKETLDAIKLKDEHPLFQAYSICHEGTSNPTILGDTSTPIHWTRAAVQSIKNTVLKGVKFFLGHNEDNSTTNRESLGEVVASAEKEIDGVLHHIVIGYFPDKEKVANKDICSQEADWNLFEAAGQWFADTLDKITGIALSNSNDDIPAFSGAKRLGLVQAFEDNKTKKRKVKAMSDIDLTTLNVNELKAEIARRGMVPSELFTLDQMKTDRVFSKVFTDNETLTKTVTERDAQIKTLNTEKETAAKQTMTATAKTRFEKMVTETKMTDKMRKYMLDSFDPNITDVTDDGLKKLIESKSNDYAKVVKSLGITDQLPGQSDTDHSKDGEDMTKTQNNPLLDADLNLDGSV